MFKKTRKKRGGSSCSSSSAALCKQISKLKDPEKKKIKEFIQAITLTLPSDTDKKSFEAAFEEFNKSIKAIQVVIDANNEEFNKKFAEFKDKPETIELTIKLLEQRKDEENLQVDSVKEFGLLIARLNGLKNGTTAKQSTTETPKPGMLGKIASKFMPKSLKNKLGSISNKTKSLFASKKGSTPIVSTVKNPLAKESNKLTTTP